MTDTLSKENLPKNTLSKETLAILREFFNKLETDPPFYSLINQENKKTFEIVLSNFITQHIAGTIMAFLRTNKLPETNKEALKEVLVHSDIYLDSCKGSYLLKTDSFIVEIWSEILSFGFIRKLSCLIKCFKYVFRKLFKQVIPHVNIKARNFRKRTIANEDPVRNSLFTVTREKLQILLKNGFDICCSECNELYPLSLGRKSTSPTLGVGEGEKEEKKREYIEVLGEIIIPCVAETFICFSENITRASTSDNIKSIIEKFLLNKLNGFWHSYGTNNKDPINEILDEIFSYNIIKGPACLLNFLKDIICKMSNGLINTLPHRGSLQKMQIYPLVKELYSNSMSEDKLPWCRDNSFACQGTKCSQNYEGKDIFYCK